MVSWSLKLSDHPAHGTTHLEIVCREDGQRGGHLELLLYVALHLPEGLLPDQAVCHGHDLLGRPRVEARPLDLGPVQDVGAHPVELDEGAARLKAKQDGSALSESMSINLAA